MKTILTTLFLALLCLTGEAQIITATVTVTNVAGITNGSTIVVNGNSRLFTNNVTAPSTQITNAASIGQGATNIWLAYVVNGENQINVFQSGTNAIIFQSFNGAPNAITIGGTFGTVTTTTVNPTNGYVVRVPKTVEGSLQRTNISSALVAWIDDNAETNVLSSGGTAHSNFVNTTLSQVIYGAKNFTGGLSGTGGVGTNRFEVGLQMTNAANFGTPFRSPGGGTASEQFGLNAAALTNAASAFGDAASAQGIDSTAIGTSTLATKTYDTALGATAAASGGSSTAVGVNSLASGYGSIAAGFGASAIATNANAIGSGSTGAYDYSTAIGWASQTTVTNQIMLGQASGTVQVPGGFQVIGGTTNSHFIGTNTWDGDVSFLRKNNTSLANGNNAAVSVSTNIYTKVSGPSGAFAINGIAGGRDGRIVMLQNSTGFTMTIANDSGVDPTAGNRIYTGTGADVALANNPGFCTLIYDSAATRWIVVSTH